MNNLNSNLPIFAIGCMLIAALYHSNLYYFNRTNVLKTYSIYLWLSLVFLYFEKFIFNGTLEKIEYTSTIYHKLIIPYLVRSVSLWLSFGYYLKLLIFACEYDYTKKSIINFIAKYFWTLLFIDLIFHYPSFFVSKENYYIFNYFWILFNFISIIIAVYFLINIYKHFRKIRVTSGLKYQIYIIFGGLSLLFFSFLTSISSLQKDHLFVLNYLSFISIGYFFEIFFFSMGISIKMQTDSLREILAVKKLSDQQIMLKHERNKVADILDNQEFKLQYERNKAINEQNNIIGRKLHDDLTGSLVALKYLINEYKNNSNQADELDKFKNIYAEIEMIYNETRDFSHLLLQTEEVAFGYAFDIKLYLQSLTNRLNELDLHQIFYKIDDIGLKQLTNKQANSVYYCIKECIISSLKHAKPQNIWITIFFEANKCYLEFKIDNNGLGTLLANEDGLKNMYKNLQQINGQLEISSTDNESIITIGFVHGQPDKS